LRERKYSKSFHRARVNICIPLKLAWSISLLWTLVTICCYYYCCCLCNLLRIVLTFLFSNFEDNPDYEKYPLFKHAKGLVCEVNAGELLYVPSKWWHQVCEIVSCFFFYLLMFSFFFCTSNRSTRTTETLLSISGMKLMVAFR
jgi:hypothetical protein